MKKLLMLFAASTLLAGCVALPYDADTVYYPNPTVNATISSGYSSGYYYGHTAPAPRYVRPYPYYQAPVYVAPVPIIVPPAVRFNYSQGSQRQNMPSVGPNYQGRRGEQRHNAPPPQSQRRDDADVGGRAGGRPSWQDDRQDNRANDRPNNRQDGRPRDGFRSR